MTKVSFENSTLADVLRKASAIAPTRGGNLSALAGIIFKLDPESDNPVTIMSSDGEVFYMETVGALSIDGEAVTWRLPSGALYAVVSALPMGGGNSITLDDSLEINRVMLKSGRTKIKLSRLDVSGYPLWEPFQDGDIATVPGLGKIIQRIKWACGQRDGSLRSVFITDGYLFSTDRFKAARVMVQTGLEGHVIVPSEQLARILPRDGDIKISKSGNLLIVSPDDFTQVATTTYSDQLLPIGKILDADYAYETKFSKVAMLACLNRALAFDSGNRQSLIRLIIGKGEIGVVTEDHEVGMFGEQVDASGDAESDERMRLQVGPQALRDAITSLSNDTVSMYYNDPESRPRVLTFRDGQYACSITLSHRDEKSEGES